MKFQACIKSFQEKDTLRFTILAPLSQVNQEELLALGIDKDQFEEPGADRSFMPSKGSTIPLVSESLQITLTDPARKQQKTIKTILSRGAKVFTVSKKVQGEVIREYALALNLDIDQHISDNISFLTPLVGSNPQEIEVEITSRQMTMG